MRPDRARAVAPPRVVGTRQQGSDYWIAFAVAFVLLAVVLTLWHLGLIDGKKHHVIATTLALMAAGIAAAAAGIVSSRQSYRERSILREIFHGNLRTGRIITDIGRNTILHNDTYRQLVGEFLGVEPDHCPGLRCIRQILAPVPESVERFDLMVDLAYRGNGEKIEVVTLVHDYPRWLRIEAQPVPGWVGTVNWRIEDITAQHELDAQIRTEREKLIDFTDNAPVGFFSAGEDGRFLFVNATLARWLGTDIDTLLNTGRLQHYLVDPPAGARSYDVTANGGARQVAELRMKGPGGKAFLAAVNQVVVTEADGKVRTRAVVHDLTAEREMRQALKDSEDRFQRFFDEAPLGIALVDSHGVLSDCNKALSAMLGMGVESIEGRNFESVIAEKDREKLTTAMAAIEEGRSMGAPLEVTLKGQDKDVVVQMHARRFRGRNIVVHFINLTEQKQLEAQFTQSQKMQAVGQLAGGVAHDFNNLLTAMIGFCDLLLLRHKPGDPSFNDIMQIKQNANRAANLVRQLLAFSRQQTMQPKVLDVTDTLTELSHLMRRLIGVMIELEIIHGPDTGLVKVDEGQLEQVLINLVVNARDAMNGQGRLTIKTQHVVTDAPQQRGADTMPAGEWVCISVIDTGCGIPRENVARIFEPFFTTKPVGSGTGLGLSTVYGIVRQTGGYVHVDSVVGQGTTFSIYLPRMAQAAAASAASAKVEDKTADLTGTATILLVEDEDAVRAFSSRALANKGYSVLDAPGGESALEVVKGHGRAPDLVITDVIMPEMDGPTLVGKLRAQYPDVPVIFVSGYTEDKFKGQFGENTHFLPKPFTLQQLAAKVKDVLA
ncbi:MAG: PAS domain S-box protein [Alphaproteobacteria bacterium]|nr:PAS domain S-box protein [Alphaproteobacteria bacterium]USO08559.1 MAG: PAS domain S-box protein [Rhodospirillales bacterium]